MYQMANKAGELFVDWSRALSDRAEGYAYRKRTLQSLLPEADFDSLDHAFDKTYFSTQEKLSQHLTSIVSELHGKPDATALLLVHLYRLCAYQWEQSDRHQPIHSTLAVILKLLGNLPASDQDNYTLIQSNFAVLFEKLGYAMRIEDALNAGSAHRMKVLARDLLATLARVASGVRTSDMAHPGGAGHPVVTWQLETLENDTLCFRAVEKIATAVDAWSRRANDWQARIVDAREELRASKAILEAKGDWYASELEAHNLSLTKIEEFGTVDRYHFDDFRIIYCFPFTVGKISPMDAIRLNPLAFEKISTKTEVSIAPIGEGRMPVNSLWGQEADEPEDDGTAAAINGNAEQVEKFVSTSYFGRFVNYEPITIRDESDNRNIVLHPELRITSLGNLYMRFEITSDDYTGFDAVTVHDIHRALRRASPNAGCEDFILSSERENKRAFICLIDIARQAINDYFSGLAAAFGERGLSAEQPVLRMDLENMYHVIFSGRSVRDNENNGAFVGQDITGQPLARLLLNPVSASAVMLEEWIAKPSGDYSAVEGVGFENSVIAKTSNVTFISLPKTPNFYYFEYEDLAETACTLEPVYVSWRSELQENIATGSRVIEGFFKSNDAERRGRRRTRNSPLSDTNFLINCRMKLHYDIARTRQNISAIRSHKIVSNSVYRRILDKLIDTSAVSKLERDLYSDINTAEALYASLSDAGHALSQQRSQAVERAQSRYQFVVQIGLGLIAILFSMDGLLRFLDIVGWTFPPATAAYVFLAGGVLALLLIISVLVRRFGR